MKSKTCTKCKESKLLEFFSTEKRSKDGKRSQCKACISKDMLKYTAENKEDKASYDKSYRLNNSFKLKEKSIEYRVNNSDKLRAYRQKNKQKIREQFKAWSEKNADRLREKRIADYANNRELKLKIASDYRSKNKDKISAYKKENREKINAYWHIRRSRNLAAGGSHTPAEIKNILLLQKNKCPVCRSDISKKYHIDHILPIAKNGTNDIKNIQILCPTCNLKKGAKYSQEFMLSMGFLL